MQLNCAITSWIDAAAPSYCCGAEFSYACFTVWLCVYTTKASEHHWSVPTCLRLFYVKIEPAVCPLLWFPVAPKLRPISYQTVRLRGCAVQPERLWRDIFYGAHETVCFTLTAGLSYLNLKVPINTLILIITSRIWVETEGNYITFTMV